MASNDATQVGVNGTMPSLCHLTVCEYFPLLRERIVSLFTAGLTDNKADAQDDYTRDHITGFLPRAVPQFNDLDAFLHAKNGGKMFLATTPSGDIAGMLAVSISDKNAKNKEVEFTRISVASVWRKKGVCRLLHDHAVRYSRNQLHAKSVYLITLSSVASGMKTYTNLGFQKAYENVLDDGGLDIETGRPVLVRFWKPL